MKFYSRWIAGLLIFLFSIFITAPLAYAEPLTTTVDVHLTAGDSQILLEWTDPEFEGFSKIKIIGAGRTVYVDKGIQTAAYADLINGITYTYKLYAVSNTGMLSMETLISGTPVDSTPPEPVSGALAIPGDSCAVIQWTDPPAQDLEKILVTNGEHSYEVDAGVENATLDGLSNGTSYEITITAIDHSENQSGGVTLNVIPEAGARLTLTGPVTVISQESFSVVMKLHSSWTNIYAVKAKLVYDTEKFQYEGYAEPGNGIMVPRLEETTQGNLLVCAASQNPITGHDNDLVRLSFRALNRPVGDEGVIKINDATVGIAPSGDELPAFVSSIRITFAEASNQTPPAEVTNPVFTVGDGTINLEWTDPSDEDFCKVGIWVDGILKSEVEKGIQEATIDGLTNGMAVDVKIVTEDNAGNLSEGISRTVQPRMPGDANFDNTVNVLDLAFAAYYYDTAVGDPNWPDAQYCDMTGLNGKPDGKVDILDIALIASNIQ